MRVPFFLDTLYKQTTYCTDINVSMVTILSENFTKQQSYRIERVANIFEQFQSANFI